MPNLSVSAWFLIALSAGFAVAQAGNRRVDFKNFSYPISGPLLGQSELKWLGNAKDGYSTHKPIHLVNGDDNEGFTLQSVKFADVTGDGREEAIVQLLYRTGGTQNTHYVYIYSFEEGKLKLLAYCHTGDRAYLGLYEVYGQGGRLVFELLDPERVRETVVQPGSLDGGMNGVTIALSKSENQSIRH